MYSQQSAACAATAQKKPLSERLFLPTRRLVLFNRFEHLEGAFGRTNKKTLVVFAQATTLQRVAAGTLAFACHGVLLIG
jgi:hypothetical protein